MAFNSNPFDDDDHAGGVYILHFACCAGAAGGIRSVCGATKYLYTLPLPAGRRAGCLETGRCVQMSAAVGRAIINMYTILAVMLEGRTWRRALTHRQTRFHAVRLHWGGAQCGPALQLV